MLGIVLNLILISLAVLALAAGTSFYVQAKEAGYAAKSKKALLHGNAKTIITRQDRSFIKVVYEEESHKVLGAQLMMGRASDLINEYTEAVANGLTMEQMASLIRPHPTFCEAADDAFAL